MMSNMVRTNGQSEALARPAEPPKAGTIQAFLSSPKIAAKLAKVAEGFMKPEDLTRVALIAIHRNPKIAQCSQESVLAALMDAAELKIRPSTLVGRGYLIPRWNPNTKKQECMFDPGWRGMIDIMRRTGIVKRIEAHAIYENDKLEVSYGLVQEFKHTPCTRGDRGKVIGSWALAELTDGSIQLEILTDDDLRKIRGASKSGENGPWAQWPDEMARKSAIRRLFKYMPIDGNVEKAMVLADRADSIDAEFEMPDAPQLYEEPTDDESRFAAFMDRIRDAATVQDINRLAIDIKAAKFPDDIETELEVTIENRMKELKAA